MLFNKNTLPEFIKNINDFSTCSTSFSPLYSNIGIEVNGDETGINAFWLHYNRFSRVIWDKLVDFDYRYDADLSSPWKLVFSNGSRNAVLSFFAPDCFMLEVNEGDKVKIAAKGGSSLLKNWRTDLGNDIHAIRGYSKNGDSRDPDEAVPFILAYKAINGKCENNIVYANENCRIIFCFEFLEMSEISAAEKINSAPDSVEKCVEISLDMIKNTVGNLSFECDEKTALIASRAVNGLISNLAKAPGYLSKYVSSYPSRGYSSHFLWDSCFQNLAYEEMNKDIAKGFLLQLVENQRPDGKYGQFLCSTWMRPHFTQPALIAWAAMRIILKTGDMNFASVIFDSVEKNNEWWLCNRMTEFGLISCPDGLETGQDDSPRFDNGATLACDMNSYLLSQIGITRDLAKILGKQDKFLKWNNKFIELSQKMKEYLFCEQDNIFYDCLLDGKTQMKIVSPVSFLPLWAGIDIGGDRADNMIKNYLLNPEYLFGEVPFPSVAYNEEKYAADGWWRGPTWMPEAWLMLEVLDKFNYQDEKYEAEKRLLKILINDGKMHELFNSQSGKGLGEEEQGWTCGIFLKLCVLLSEKED